MKIPELIPTGVSRTLQVRNLAIAFFVALPLCVTLVLVASFQTEYASHLRIANVRFERITAPEFDFQGTTGDGWSNYRGADFQISFPKTPEVQNCGRQTICRTDGTASFNLSVTHFPATDQRELNDNQQLDQMCRSLIERNRYANHVVRTLDSGDVAVKEMVCRTGENGEVDIWKICLANDKLYAAAVIGHTNEVDTQVRQFLDSLQVQLPE